jgi:outer membrane lipoprotein SlyB
MARRPVHVPGDDYAEPNLLFRGTAGGRLEEVPGGGTGATLAATSRAAAFGDVDGDGALDVLVVNRDSPAHLLLNRAPRSGEWIALRVLDSAGAPALHAALEVTVAGSTRRAEVRSASSYLTASAPVVHLGLGAAREVERVRVRFPDGAEAEFGPLAAGAVHILSHPEGR